MKIRVKVEGLSEMVDAFRELPKATGKNAMKRIIEKRLQPIATEAESKAPKNVGTLKRSIRVGTRLSRSQAKLIRDSKSYTEMYAGAGTNPQSTFQEFGTRKFSKQPFLTPAWEHNKDKMLTDIKDDLWAEISKAAERIAKKTARLARKG